MVELMPTTSPKLSCYQSEQSLTSLSFRLKLGLTIAINHGNGISDSRQQAGFEKTLTWMFGKRTNLQTTFNFLQQIWARRTAERYLQLHWTLPTWEQTYSDHRLFKVEWINTVEMLTIVTWPPCKCVGFCLELRYIQWTIPSWRR